MIIMGHMGANGDGPYPQDPVINPRFTGAGGKCCPANARCMANIPPCPIGVSRGDQCPEGMMWDDGVQNCIPIFIDRIPYTSDDVPQNTGIVPPNLPPPILPVRRGPGGRGQETYMVDATTAYLTIGAIAIMGFMLLFGGSKK